MKKLAAIIGACLIGLMAQAQTASSTGSTSTTSTANQGQSVKSHKRLDPQQLLAKLDEAISKRQAQEQEATSKGHTDITSAIQKIITDLNAMKTALNNKDKVGFKAANEQRKKDREALQALRKTDRQANKHEKNSGSTTTTASTPKP